MGKLTSIRSSYRWPFLPRQKPWRSGETSFLPYPRQNNTKIWSQIRKPSSSNSFPLSLKGCLKPRQFNRFFSSPEIGIWVILFSSGRPQKTSSISIRRVVDSRTDMNSSDTLLSLRPLFVRKTMRRWMIGKPRGPLRRIRVISDPLIWRID